MKLKKIILFTTGLIAGFAIARLVTHTNNQNLITLTAFLTGFFLIQLALHWTMEREND